MAGLIGRFRRRRPGAAVLRRVDRVIYPDTIDEEDVLAIGRLWKQEAASWWRETGRSSAKCDECNAGIDQPDGSLWARRLLCEACADHFLADGLAKLRQDPYTFGPMELWLARQRMVFPPPSHLRLDWESLFTKYGFADGDVPEDFDRWRREQGLAPIDWGLDGDWHGVLDQLVRTRLLPELDRHGRGDHRTDQPQPGRAFAVDGIGARRLRGAPARRARARTSSRSTSMCRTTTWRRCCGAPRTGCSSSHRPSPRRPGGSA